VSEVTAHSFRIELPSTKKSRTASVHYFSSRKTKQLFGFRLNVNASVTSQNPGFVVDPSIVGRLRKSPASLTHAHHPLKPSEPRETVHAAENETIPWVVKRLGKLSRRCATVLSVVM
jgi:hypothetical protein